MEATEDDTAVFRAVESEVRIYSRQWPAVFDKALGSWLYAADGRPFLDFFSAAGSLNYGHNNLRMKIALLDYIARDGIVQGLDMFTAARRDFLTAFDELVLRPRGLPYRVMFPGPSGASAVEAALKLARKVTGRENVVFFTNGFHGMSLGALAVTGSSAKRDGAGVRLADSVVMPFDGYRADGSSGLDLLEQLVGDRGSGFGRPAAAIVETVQGEGGVNVASSSWLRELAGFCRRAGMLLIVDDVQMGCGRTGGFFSFEESGVVPDIVTLSKSLSGYGLPLGLTLLREDLDVWQPGEHSGTFRGNNLAFVTATTALYTYWADDALQRSTAALAQRVEHRLRAICEVDGAMTYRGRGLAWGLGYTDGRPVVDVCRRAFDKGLLVEPSGATDHIVKLMPALTIKDEELDEGLDILAAAVGADR